MTTHSLTLKWQNINIYKLSLNDPKEKMLEVQLKRRIDKQQLLIKVIRFRNAYTHHICENKGCY